MIRSPEAAAPEPLTEKTVFALRQKRFFVSFSACGIS